MSATVTFLPEQDRAERVSLMANATSTITGGAGTSARLASTRSSRRLIRGDQPSSGRSDTLNMGSPPTSVMRLRAAKGKHVRYQQNVDWQLAQLAHDLADAVLGRPGQCHQHLSDPLAADQTLQVTAVTQQRQACQRVWHTPDTIIDESDQTERMSQ